MHYNPHPIDTSNVKLPRDVTDLVELLAKNSHEVWARKRIAEGWTLGQSRNDSEKQHPNLVPYEDLINSEKEYDRETILETLKVIFALGYRIER